MKKLKIISLLILLASNLKAQDKKLFSVTHKDSSKIIHGSSGSLYFNVHSNDSMFIKSQYWRDGSKVFSIYDDGRIKLEKDTMSVILDLIYMINDQQERLNAVTNALYSNRKK